MNELAEKKKGKQVGPRLTPKAKEFYEQNFGKMTVNAASGFVLEAFPALYKRALKEIEGKFSLEELSLLMDTLNSTDISPHTLGQSIKLSATDAIDLDGLDKKWGVDRGVLLEKFSRLTTFQEACLEIFIKSYWWSGVSGQEDGVKDWCEPLL